MWPSRRYSARAAQYFRQSFTLKIDGTRIPETAGAPLLVRPSRWQPAVEQSPVAQIAHERGHPKVHLRHEVARLVGDGANVRIPIREDRTA